MSEKASSAGQGRERFTARRRTRRRKVFVLLSILFTILIVGLLWGLWQDEVRVSRVQVFGGSQSIGEIVREVMRGRYAGIVPRDSVFFVPEADIRSRIFSSDSNIAAVSIFHSNFDSISIRVDYRTPVGRWCGASFDSTADSVCYLFDVGGYIFSVASSTTPIINTFRLYAPLTEGGTDPLRATIIRADDLPATFDFARKLATFGSPTIRIVLQEDEIEYTLSSGTRIRYLIGQEQDAYTALVSGTSGVNLADGSIEYIDLRFSGKVYVKRVQSSTP